MRAVKDVLDKTLAAACVVLFAALVLTVSWQVFSRQVLNDPSTWSEELARYVFIWLGLLGAALVFSERGHIAVDLAARRMPERVQHWLAIAVQGVIAAFALGVLVWGGGSLSTLTWDHGLPVLPGTLGPIYLVLPISGALITFFAVHHAVSLLRRSEHALPDDGLSEPM